MIDGHFGTRLKWGLLVVASLREWAERQVIAFLDRVYAPRIIAEVMRQAQPAIATEVMRQAQSAEQRHLTQSFHVWMARSPGDILSDWEIECFAAASSSSKGDPATAEDVRQSLQGTSIPLLEKIIADVGSVLDVGVAVGNFMHVMAKAHPDVKFIGVDFWSNLLELNEPLLLPNFTVKQGYALPMIEAGLTADVVHFCSTATRIKENELRRYIRSIPKYVVFNEPLFRLPDGSIPDPDTHGMSMPILVYSVYAGDRYGGLPPCLCHNYRAMLEAASFEILHYEVVTDESRVGTTARVMVIGKRAAP